MWKQGTSRNFFSINLQWNKILKTPNFYVLVVRCYLLAYFITEPVIASHGSQGGFAQEQNKKAVPAPKVQIV